MLREEEAFYCTKQGKSVIWTNLSVVAEIKWKELDFVICNKYKVVYIKQIQFWHLWVEVTSLICSLRSK